MLESKIDSSREESRSNDQTANLDVKADAVPGVFVHHDSTSKSESFAEAADSHGDHVCPCLPPDARGEVDDATGREEGEEEGIRAEGWVVAVDGLVNSAEVGDLHAIVAVGDYCGIRHCGENRNDGCRNG